MSITWLITKREYLTRVKKKSFIIMTILGPLLIAGFYAGLIALAINNSENQEIKTIAVADYSGLLGGTVEDEDYWKFIQADTAIPPDSQTAKGIFFATLIISPGLNADHPSGIRLISEKPISISNKSYLEKKVQEVIRNKKLERAGIRKTTLDSLDTRVHIKAVVSTNEGVKASNSGINSAIGFVGSFAIYIFIFIYGMQVMKGVLEEKTNRIVEIIISSVKPFQLMIGKIAGIALVGLTQLVIWIFLSAVLVGIISAFAGPELLQTAGDQQSAMSPGSQAIASETARSESGEIISALFALNLPKIIFSFIFYFITGYLLYSALFASIAAAIDNETDNQQFMLPVTLPLVFGIVVAMTTVTNDPHSSLAIWFSMIPLTSPIVMMVRVPFDVPDSELLLSMSFMVLGFLGTTWLASRIYRVGILMYGKKASYRELWKWIRYKG